MKRILILLFGALALTATIAPAAASATPAPVHAAYSGQHCIDPIGIWPHFLGSHVCATVQGAGMTVTTIDWKIAGDGLSGAFCGYVEGVLSVFTPQLIGIQRVYKTGHFCVGTASSQGIDRIVQRLPEHCRHLGCYLGRRGRVRGHGLRT